MKIIGVIPARYGSTRFPGKILADIHGKPLIWYVYNQVKKSKLLNEIFIATDDERIKKVVESFGGKVIMTLKEHNSGTDRIAEAVKNFNCEIVVNIQGDEPLIKPEAIDSAIRPFLDEPDLVMSTLKTKIKPGEEQNQNSVKVVCDKNDFALYFSRSPIPFKRNCGETYKHVGLYVYKKDFIEKFSKLQQTPLEKSESLEQLRALENGFKIKVIETEYDSIGVDTPEDLERVKNRLI